MKKSARPYHHGGLRAALLEAAEKALASGEGGDLSLRELSRKIGVSYTAPRRHFANKQALLDALAIEGFRRLEAALNRSIAGKGSSFDAKLKSLASAHIRFALKHRELLRLMFHAKYHKQASPELIQAGFKALSAGPFTIAEGQAAGSVIEGDPRSLALTVFAAVEGLISFSTNGELNGIPLNRLAGEVIEQIILGLRPRPELTSNTSRTRPQYRPSSHPPDE